MHKHVAPEQQSLGCKPYYATWALYALSLMTIAKVALELHLSSHRCKRDHFACWIMK